MPFGLFFAAIYFALFCSVMALRSFLWSQPLARPAGILFLICSIALAVGLFRRRSWARWLAAVAAAVLVPVTMRAFVDDGGVLALIWMLGNLLVILLLALPATGRDSRQRQPPESRALGGAGWLAVCSLIGVVIVVFAMPSHSGSSSTVSVASGAMPASARALPAIEWVDFSEGMRRARQGGRPMLVTFVTDWCPYCKKMDRTTWKASTVMRQMQDMIAVRVDAEQESSLAERYDVRGFPAQLLLDGDGRTLARRDGYQTARELINWLQSNGTGSY